MNVKGLEPAQRHSSLIVIDKRQIEKFVPIDVCDEKTVETEHEQDANQNKQGTLDLLQRRRGKEGPYPLRCGETWHVQAGSFDAIMTTFYPAEQVR